MRSSHSKKVAVCGMLCALCVALMLLGNMLGIGTYAAPMLASLLLVPVGQEYGTRWALLLYGATALLSLIVVPDKELALFYALVMGYYPVLHTALRGIRSSFLRWCAKILCFNVAVFAMYALLLFVFVSPSLREEFSQSGTPLLIALIALGNVAFVLFDIALDKLALLYRLRLRAKLRRLL